MADHVSTRVNSARLKDYVGKTVRLTCKVLRLQGDEASVEATDGGQVKILLMQDMQLNDTFIEVVGGVLNAETIKMQGCLNLGSELDMKLANDVVELIHAPQPEINSMFF